MLNRYFKIILLSSSLVLGNNSFAESCEVERVAFEFGSGTTKVVHALVDKCQQKIVKTFKKTHRRIPYQHYISLSPDNNLIIDMGVKEGQKSISSILEELNVDCKKIQCFGVGTAAFRNSTNGEEYLKNVKNKFNINTKIISQEDEGKLGFLSGYYGLKALKPLKKSEVMVVDIGGGSYQISFINDKNELSAFHGSVGSTSFKNALIELVQNRAIYEIGTTNPMTKHETKKSLAFGSSLITDSIMATPEMRKIIKEKPYLAGTGRLLSVSVANLIKEDKPLTEKLLLEWINKLTLKSDEAINSQFKVDDANTLMANLILVKSIIEAFKGRELFVVGQDNTDIILLLGPDLEIKTLFN